MSRPSSRSLHPLVALLACAVALAACGDATDDDASEATPTLRVVTTEVPTLDPLDALEPEGAMLAALVTEPLVHLDPVTYDAAPGLARSWEVADDQQRFTFEVAEDATFHDGSPVTAADVVASLQRAVDPASESPLGALLAPVRGFEEARAGTGALEGLRADGATTVVVELDEPRADFPLHLAHPGLGIVALPDGDAPPVGTGPFVPGERDGSTLVLSAAEGTEAEIDAVEVRTVDEPDDAAREVAQGRADLALVPGDVELVEGVEERRTPILAVSYYGLDATHPGLADPRLRRAIQLAVDAEALVAAGYAQGAAAAVGIAPEVLPGVGATVCGDVCGPDPEHAAALVAELSAVEEPAPITIDFDDTEVQRDVAAEISEQLAAVGLATELRPHEPGDYTSFLADGDPMIFRLGWVADAPTPRAFLVPAFAPGAPENLTRVDVEAVTAGVATADGAPDPEARADAFREAQRAVLEAGAALPVAQLLSRYAVGPAVRDLEVTLFGSFVATAVGLDRQEG